MPAKKKNTARRSSFPESAEEGQRGRATPRPQGATEKDEIGRAQILRKYWELANLDPEITKGTITGQLKALDSLCGELGLAAAASGSESDGKGEAKGAPTIYRSAWIRTAARRPDAE